MFKLINKVSVLPSKHHLICTSDSCFNSNSSRVQAMPASSVSAESFKCNVVFEGIKAALEQVIYSELFL